MNQVNIFKENVADYEAWYEKYPEVYQSEVAAIKEQLLKLPENIKGIEVGLGTGRFAQELGIKEGVEPAIEMAEIALKRGIEVVNGNAENLPMRDMYFKT
jgi:ubiquinone/menaquinone biosynthesis C-methylase UbiE